MDIIVGSIAIFTFLLSLPILASVIWLLYMRDYDCEELLRLPKVQVGIGIALICAFLISNAAVLLRSRIPALGFLLAMVMLIMMFTAGLALLGVYKMASRKVLASPAWLRAKVYDDRHWNNIKSCIYDTGACNDLIKRMSTVKSYDFNMKKLSSIESGCCRPPAICDMDYVNATFWRRKSNIELPVNNSQIVHNDDCDAWRNDMELMCYNCDSCREGFLSALETKWWKLGLFLVLMSLLLTVSHLLLFLASMWQRVAG
ncbi:hypothetical protein CDL15_Pgr012593 [Punica granatum]|nr:hypothetical protein CDL15_Pgr012593 [Punica granatum]